jgi:hypothetical protein
MSLFVMAQCIRPCGWIGPGYERKARGDASEGFFCPECRGPTKSWISDLDREQQAIDRDKSARIDATQQLNDRNRQARLANQRLHDAQRQTERARHRLAMLRKDDPRCLEAQRAMLVAENEEAEAFLAHAQAVAGIKALG